NPVWPEMGYPGPLDTPPDVPRAIRPLSVERPATLECDAVIVGSGAGGGMVAAELARAGNDVIVVEKGGYYNEADFTQREVEMLRRLYLDGGLSASADQGVVIVAGSCLGGGTVVNYTTSFRTPDRVREEWARRSGLSFFTSPDFTRSLDAACERLHVNLDHNRPSSRDAIMARGLEACGWHVGRMPRDVRGCTQDDVCGYCGMGCVRGAKCSSLHALLPEAQGHGARMLVDTEAERVLMEGGRAVGILARTRAGNGLTVRARAVVAAAGAINSPALLLRSGLRSPVGEDLTLHPATPVWGLFDEEVRPWTGTLQALYSDQFADLDGGYGVKLETAPMHPALLGLACPWESAEDFERLMRGLSHASLIGILLRDRYGGRVRIGRGGLPVVNYRLSRYDQRHIRAGVEAAARVLQAAGAREILSAQNRPVSFKPGGESLEGWLARVDRVGYGANQMVYFSFHQMGTCRMGSRQRTSVVNGEGEVHTVKNLFVADGSLFPSASGVNPMVSISALAHYVAQHIKARL
ncbi:MAG: GMC family oxidoreductase, partial [Chloroflexi bacterium]|nr:GMC family oxidoreductase [Chloroflexota bacterium]